MFDTVIDKIIFQNGDKGFVVQFITEKAQNVYKEKIANSHKKNEIIIPDNQFDDILNLLKSWNLSVMCN